MQTLAFKSQAYSMPVLAVMGHVGWHCMHMLNKLLSAAYTELHSMLFRSFCCENFGSFNLSACFLTAFMGSFDHINGLIKRFYKLSITK